jgi:hypothetical protein
VAHEAYVSWWCGLEATVMEKDNSYQPKIKEKNLVLLNLYCKIYEVTIILQYNCTSHMNMLFIIASVVSRQMYT